MRDAESSPASKADTPPPRTLERALVVRETRRFLKFLVVGAFGFVVDTGSLSAFVLLFSLDRVLAKGLAFGLGVLSNFLWNRYWTYPDSRSKHPFAQALQFVFLSSIGLAINLGVFALVDGLLASSVDSVVALYVAQCAAVGGALFWNFAANRLLTYSDVRLGQ